jgi:hypothetical protein
VALGGGRSIVTVSILITKEKGSISAPFYSILSRGSNMTSNPWAPEYPVRVVGTIEVSRVIMNDKDQTTKGGIGPSPRKRWDRDMEGVLHYHGACPFNNALCRMRNFAARKKIELKGSERT